MKENLYVDIDPSLHPEIGRRLWMLQDTRQRTMTALAGVSQAVVDWQPQGGESSIATVLYHIAGIEADWLYTEVLEQPIPPEIDAFFPFDIRDDQGHLFQVQGWSLEQHLHRLEVVRGQLLEAYRQMDLAAFRRARSLEKYDVTPEWVLHHLMQHEAEHRGQIGALRARAEHLSAG